jgi:hypothetical protein
MVGMGEDRRIRCIYFVLRIAMVSLRDIYYYILMHTFYSILLSVIWRADFHADVHWLLKHRKQHLASL